MLECVRGAEFKRIAGELWAMCQNITSNKCCASVNVGPELSVFATSTITEHGSDESGFPVFKGSRQRGGWPSTCSARGADLHRLFGDMSKQSGLQSGTEGETGRSHNRGTDERESRKWIWSEPNWWRKWSCRRLGLRVFGACAMNIKRTLVFIVRRHC